LALKSAICSGVNEGRPMGFYSSRAHFLPTTHDAHSSRLTVNTTGDEE
jgi:hypothetical protein